MLAKASVSRKGNTVLKGLMSIPYIAKEMYCEASQLLSNGQRERGNPTHDLLKVIVAQLLYYALAHRPNYRSISFDHGLISTGHTAHTKTRLLDRDARNSRCRL